MPSGKRFDRRNLFDSLIFNKSYDPEGGIYDSSFWGFDYISGYDILIDIPDKKCTCGVTTTLGKDVDISFHSEYCDLKK